MGDALLRHILYVSGTRADYGPARSVLRALSADPGLHLAVVVTGMHLDPVHGETWKEIERDGFEIAGKVDAHVVGDDLEAMAASMGRALEGMAHVVARHRPDIVLVLGDRGEQLAAAVAAALQNRVVAHLCGGSLSGSIDDSIRHAITKFAHYHFPACEEHACRIIQLGEEPETVEVVGIPGGDLRPDVSLSREEVCTKYDMSPAVPYLLVVQHPVTQSRDNVEAQITSTLDAVAAMDLPALLANPNDDAGGRVILEAMESYAGRFHRLRILPPPASRTEFASIMAHAGAVVGNSSSGIVEAMSVRVPVVNIGERQRGREGHACVVSVPHDSSAIQAGIRTALFDNAYRSQLAHFESGLIGPTEQLVREALLGLDLSRAHRPKPFHGGRG